MSIPRFTGQAVIATILFNMLTVVAFAGDRHHRHPDVDIESLKSELRWINGEWLLEVHYEVEVEDYWPLPGELELILTITEHSRTLVDHTGNPIEFIVPLEYPSEEDDDELEFEDRITITLPQQAIGDPKHLRLESVIVRVSDGYPLDRKDKSIKFKHRKHRGGSVSVGIGVGLTSVSYHRGSVRYHRVVHRRARATHRRVSITQRRTGHVHRHSGARQHRPAVGVRGRRHGNSHRSTLRPAGQRRGPSPRAGTHPRRPPTRRRGH